jgi:hypothetical protein
VGSSDAHFELNRDPEQVRSEAISVANEFNGLLWVERVQVATTPKIDRHALLQRDDPVGEVARIAAELRQDSSILASWDVVADLKKKLPADLVEGTEAIALDPIALNAALEEAESLLLARLSVSGTL